MNETNTSFLFPTIYFNPADYRRVVDIITFFAALLTFELFPITIQLFLGVTFGAGFLREVYFEHTGSSLLKNASTLAYEASKLALGLLYWQHFAPFFTIYLVTKFIDLYACDAKNHILNFITEVRSYFSTNQPKTEERNLHKSKSCDTLPWLEKPLTTLTPLRKSKSYNNLSDFPDGFLPEFARQASVRKASNPGEHQDASEGQSPRGGLGLTP